MNSGATLPLTLHLLGALAWGAFVLTWFPAVAWVSPAIKRVSWVVSALDGVVYALCFALLFAPREWVGALWQTPTVPGCLLLAGELSAFAFAWWARLHLGKLWSAWITLRTGHRLITSGPYRLVRHPVYTGFIGAAWAFALLTATPTALAGAAMLAMHMAWKARREERFLQEELGAAEYASYAARTPMLVPRLIRRA